MNDDTPIVYRFLNMDAQRFESDEFALQKAVGSGGLMRAIPSFGFDQVLIAGGGREFSETEAILLSRRLSQPEGKPS